MNNLKDVISLTGSKLFINLKKTNFRSDPVEEHPDDGASLLVRDDVKYFIHLFRMPHWNLNRMAVVQRVEVQCAV